MLSKVSHTVAIDRAFVILMPKIASLLPAEERYCRGDRTWYTLDAYLEWAVQFFGTKEDALHYWQKRMKPSNAKQNVTHHISSVHVDRRVAPEMCKPGMPPDLLQNGEPQHAYEWNEVQGEFYCRLCGRFATGRHTLSEKHKYRSQNAEAYLWEPGSQKSSSSSQCSKETAQAKTSQSQSASAFLPTPEWRGTWSAVD